MHDPSHRIHTTAAQTAQPPSSEDATANTRALESTMAALENAQEAVAFNSGSMALYAAILTVVPPGGSLFVPPYLDEVKSNLLEWLASSMHVQVHRINYADQYVNDLIEQVTPSAILCESIEPLTGYAAVLHELIPVARAAGSRLIVDNTAATPFLTQPLDTGADLVVHSSLNFLTGHPDLSGGAVAGSFDLMQITRGQRDLMGASPGAFEAWLTLRGIQTMAVRMDHTCKSARQVATWMEGQHYIENIVYPGITTDANHETAKSLFRRNSYGTLIGFNTGYDDGIEEFLDTLTIIRTGSTVGGANSVIYQPHTLATSEDVRGETLRTFMLSIGLEDPNDLIRDFSRAASFVTEEPQQ